MPLPVAQGSTPEGVYASNRSTMPETSAGTSISLVMLRTGKRAGVAFKHLVAVIGSLPVGPLLNTLANCSIYTRRSSALWDTGAVNSPL